MIKIDTNKTLYGALLDVVELYPDKEILVLGDTHLTFRQFIEKVDALASGLTKLGIGKGDRVGLILPVCVEGIVSFFAFSKIGAPFIPMNPQFRSSEVKHILSDAEAVGVITLGELMGFNYIDLIEGIRPDLPDLKHVIVYGEGAKGDAIPLTDILAAEPEPYKGEPISSEDAMYLLYTSGTTGLPKGAMKANQSELVALNACTEYLTPEEMAAILNPFPLFHFAGIMLPLLALLTGNKVVMVPRFHPIEMLGLIEEEQVTLVVAAPAMMKLMMDVIDIAPRDLSSVKVVAMGAAPVPTALINAVRERLGSGVFNAYGMTEMGLISISSPNYPVEIQATTIGRPPPGVGVKIVNEERREVPIGQAGEIACNTPQAMMGYFNNPEQTAKSYDDEGYFYTGDIGSFDEEGYLRIFDRKADMIIRGGENIYPAEIEHYLMSHPKIQMAGVIGIPSKVSGETVRAYILLKEDEELSEVEVLDFCRGNIAVYKTPEEVRFVESLPLTSLMKVKRYQLRQEAIRELEG
ncbi:class I adenylate-forming enzyme family protein [Chloroflexota bacterium]